MVDDERAVCIHNDTVSYLRLGLDPMKQYCEKTREEVMMIAVLLLHYGWGSGSIERVARCERL